ncbi:MAG TPA: UDP-3-O-acyl-N-acetylglucosamine deacetylase [Caulobacteraceae bacterium]|nr:UDP-3-O-acyl-N-acetylglucosamine deacetylase [Caulobacteraceae bacterium]
MSEFHQHTLASSAICAGVGLHSGQHVRLCIRPAHAGSGIVFVRTDVQGDNRIKVAAEAVVQARLCTVIANSAGVTVATIEHLMAALAALSIDNAVIELDGPELPIMDGSALPFVQLLDRAGRRQQDAERSYIEVLDTIEVIDGDKLARLSPAERFEVAFEIEFPTALIGRQRVDLAVDEHSFRAELADCRTFGFAAEVEALRAAGLARGGSLENAVVIDGERLLNPEGLRRPDEFVRHKALDAVGDLYTLGAPLIGRFEGVKAGHALNNLVARALLEQPQAWRLRPFSEDLARAAV